MAVQEFMSDGVVKIDSAIAVISGVTYPIRAISSVSVVQDHMRPERQKAIFTMIVGGLLIFVGVREPTILVLGVPIALAGYIYYRSIRDQFALTLVSHSGSRRVLESNDREYVIRVRDNLVQAITAAA